ncbi:MAG: hypothetical protein V3V15_09270 [Sphingorhabdus sp.]
MKQWLSNFGVLNFLVLAGYAIAILEIFVAAGVPGENEAWLWALLFFLWCVAPIAFPLVVLRRSWLVTLIVALIAIYSIYEYTVGMRGPDTTSTSALILLSLPIYQWGVITLLFGIWFLPPVFREIYKEFRKLANNG